MKIVAPVLLVKKQVCLQNIRRMHAKTIQRNIILRPHFKTHQSEEVGRWFMDHNIHKITVSSLEMAWFFIKKGWKDITIALPLNPNWTNEINSIPEDVTINLLAESLESIRSFSGHLKKDCTLFLKIDVGYHRCGIHPENTREIEKILEFIGQSKHLTFKGFLSHAGQSYHAQNKDEIKRIYKSSLEKLLHLKNHFSRFSDDLILSYGDTPTCSIVDNFSGLNEIRAGNFIYYDLMQLKLGSCSRENIAVCLAAPVLSLHPERNEILLHAGAVHLSKEQLKINGKSIFGLIVKCNEHGWQFIDENAYLVSLSQEHGIVHASNEFIRSLSPGDTLGIIPVHSCLTANLMKDKTLYI